METLELTQQTTVEDFLPLNGTDYIELYVGNARQSAHYFQTAFGFQPVAHAGLATGLRDRESYVVQQGKIRLVLTSPLHGDSEIGRHIDQHGDGVRVVALWVDDATKAFEETIRRGAYRLYGANPRAGRTRLCGSVGYSYLRRHGACICGTQ